MDARREDAVAGVGDEDEQADQYNEGADLCERAGLVILSVMSFDYD